MKQIKSEHLMSAFWSGVAYGQLIMEQERMMEEEFDAFQGHLIDKKFCMPSHPAPRRQLRSEKWFEEMRKEKRAFFEMYASFVPKKQEVCEKQNCLFDE